MLLLVINAIINVTVCNGLLYAHSLKYNREVSSGDDCRMLQEDLLGLGQYVASLNRLSLIIIAKCALISISRKQLKQDFTYSLKNLELTRYDIIRDLGVSFVQCSTNI